jgi:hypothetical protein
MKLVAICSIGALLLVSLPGWSATTSRAGSVIPKRAIAFPIDGIYKKRSYKGYRVTQIPKQTYEVPPLLSREEANKILPTTAPTTPEESNMMMRRMGDKAVGLWLKSSTMQNLSVVQTAQKVEQAMKAEVGFGGGVSDDGEKSIQHKVNFQFQAFQATSKIDYSGFVNASVTYNLRDQVAGVEVREKVLEDKDLFVNMSSSKTEDLGSVGIKWSF